MGTDSVCLIRFSRYRLCLGEEMRKCRVGLICADSPTNSEVEEAGDLHDTTISANAHSRTVVAERCIGMRFRDSDFVKLCRRFDEYVVLQTLPFP